MNQEQPEPEWVVEAEVTFPLIRAGIASDAMAQAGDIIRQLEAVGTITNMRVRKKT